MQAVDLFRASVFNSSFSAFYLAVENSKYMDFSCKLIRVKNENAHCRLMNSHHSSRAYSAMEKKVEKYQTLLYMLENVYSIPPSSCRPCSDRANIS